MISESSSFLNSASRTYGSTSCRSRGRTACRWALGLERAGFAGSGAKRRARCHSHEWQALFSGFNANWDGRAGDRLPWKNIRTHRQPIRAALQARRL